jgi:hypothetical protein
MENIFKVHVIESRNVWQLSTFDVAYNWKPKFYTELQLQKPKNMSNTAEL